MVRKLISICKTFIGKIKDNKLRTVLIGCIGLLMLKLFRTNKEGIPLIQISRFLDMIEAGNIKQAVIKPNLILFTDKMDNIWKSNLTLMPKQILFNIVTKAKIPFAYSNHSLMKQFLLFLFFSSITLLSFLYFSSRQDIEVQKKPQKIITFNDIVGLKDAKLALGQVIQYMKNPLKFQNIGARMRKGIILYGPPGTGKTTIAKACANQARVQFFACNASEFCQIYVGVGPKKVRQLFKKAKEVAPSIIFIDEIDAIGNRKGRNNYDSSADTQRNSTINQLLSEMDGFGSHDSVLVIGATNKLQLLDKSLLRPGRFDLKINVSLPKTQQRYEILMHHLNGKRHNLSYEYLKNLSEKTIGASGADLQNITNESVYEALRRNSYVIQEIDVVASLKHFNISNIY